MYQLQGCILFRIPPYRKGGGKFISHLERFQSCREGKTGKDEAKGKEKRREKWKFFKMNGTI